MRLVVRKAWLSGGIDRDQARSMLRDPDRLELLADLAAEKMLLDDDPGQEGPLLRVIRFLLENKDELIALIQLIVALFADGDVADIESVAEIT